MRNISYRRVDNSASWIPLVVKERSFYLSAQNLTKNRRFYTNFLHSIFLIHCEIFFLTCHEWRIQDFPEGAPILNCVRLLFDQILPQTARKWRMFSPGGYLWLPSDPPMLDAIAERQKTEICRNRRINDISLTFASEEIITSFAWQKAKTWCKNNKNYCNVLKVLRLNTPWGLAVHDGKYYKNNCKIVLASVNFKMSFCTNIVLIFQIRPPPDPPPFQNKKYKHYQEVSTGDLECTLLCL